VVRHRHVLQGVRPALRVGRLEIERPNVDHIVAFLRSARVKRQPHETLAHAVGSLHLDRNAAVHELHAFQPRDAFAFDGVEMHRSVLDRQSSTLDVERGRIVERDVLRGRGRGGSAGQEHDAGRGAARR
jgi:hypothetical protein